MSKVGIVLEGGGMRGAYTAGCLAWFLRNKIDVDHVTGVSSGALYGALYLTKDESLLKKASTVIAPSKEAIGIRPLFNEGQIIGYNRMYDEIIFEEGFRLEDLDNMETTIDVAVYDLEKYETIWKNKQDLQEKWAYMKAACSLPFYSKFVKIDGVDYTDGGVTTMIPLTHSMSVGCDKNIVITTKSKDYVRKPFSKFVLWFLRNFLGRKHLKMVDDFSKRTDVYYNERQLVNREVKQKKAVYLYPTRETGVTRYSGTKDQFEDLYQMGIDDCEKQREAIMELLQK